MKFATLFRSGLARFCAVLALAVVCGLSASAQTFLHEGLVWKNNKGKLELQKPSVAPENGEAPGDYTGDYVIPTEITYNGTTYTVSTLKAAFKATNVHSVVMPAGVGMSRGCFQDCPELVAITLPSDIAKLEGNTFQNCVKLQSITIPGTVAELTTSLFNNCPALEEMIIEDGAKPLVLQAASFGTSYIKRLTVNRALSEGAYTAMDQKPWRGNANIEEPARKAGGKAGKPRSARHGRRYSNNALIALRKLHHRRAENRLRLVFFQQIVERAERAAARLIGGGAVKRFVHGNRINLFHLGIFPPNFD